jgi:hypothetical protein
MLGKLVAIDVSLAVGGWGGGDFVIIEQGMKNAGLLPQVSAGLALSF